jgi:hypothetical protein
LFSFKKGDEAEIVLIRGDKITVGEITPQNLPGNGSYGK